MSTSSLHRFWSLYRLRILASFSLKQLPFIDRTFSQNTKTNKKQRITWLSYNLVFERGKLHVPTEAHHHEEEILSPFQVLQLDPTSNRSNYCQPVSSLSLTISNNNKFHCLFISYMKEIFLILMLNFPPLCFTEGPFYPCYGADIKQKFPLHFLHTVCSAKRFLHNLSILSQCFSTLVNMRAYLSSPQLYQPFFQVLYGSLVTRSPHAYGLDQNAISEYPLKA